MIEPKILQVRIREILAFCDQFNKAKYGSEQKKAAYKSFWNVVKALDDEVVAIGRADLRKYGELTMAGRFVRWQVNDGYARYIVVKVGKKTSWLLHLPYQQGYKSAAVSPDGEASTDEIEKILEFEWKLSNAALPNAVTIPKSLG